jgi:hypothetical protein
MGHLLFLVLAEASLNCGACVLEMVSKPSGGKVATVNYRGKPPTSRVLKQDSRPSIRPAA